VSHTHQELARMASLAGAVDVADIGARLAVLTHAPDTITVARAAIDRIAPALADVRTLTADNPNQQQRLDQLEPLLRAHVAHFEAALSGADPTVVQPAEDAATCSSSPTSKSSAPSRRTSAAARLVCCIAFARRIRRAPV
jgi:CHASE3 domain sensor protein